MVTHRLESINRFPRGNRPDATAPLPTIPRMIDNTTHAESWRAFIKIDFDNNLCIHVPKRIAHAIASFGSRFQLQPDGLLRFIAGRATMTDGEWNIASEFHRSDDLHPAFRPMNPTTSMFTTPFFGH